ncbi:hypothetical protein TSOC_003886 [Tetrabaena socialis]|uniref:phytol kinase n=1 Tax=Tetrabaena socialis TaxID=47790 RepID=A0A2J8AAC2_9CHLO|nr:hypothetical protein TSOC_003886 [Tetrabaena socialis]|eukprot:PNH09472.1 hypothetical protein TSOC_003886 [Tetrabaena socialis]
MVHLRIDRLLASVLAVPDGAGRPRQLKEDDVEELGELLATVRVHLDRFPPGSTEGVTVAASILADAAVRSTASNAGDAILRLVAAVIRWPLLAPSSILARGHGSGPVGGGSGGSTSGSSTGDSGSGNGGSGTGGSGTDGTGTGGSSGGGTSGLDVGEGIQAYATVARETCLVVDALLRLLFELPLVSFAALGFMQKLLRMHTLQCLARQFAAAADSAGALTAQQESYAKYLFYMLNSLTRSLHTDPSAQLLFYAGLRRQLAEALRDSRVMEHAARLLLLQRLLRPGAPAGAALPANLPAADTCHVFLTVYQNMSLAVQSATQAEGQDVPARAALCEVLAGRCALHMVLVQGVAALCMADGGPAYGLPEGLQQAVSARLTAEFPPGPQELHQLQDAILLGLLTALANVGRQLRGARAAVVVLLRLARLAVTSGDVWAAQAQQRRAGLPAHAGGARLVVPRSRVLLAAKGSLNLAWRLLRQRLAANAPAWAEEAGVECWRLVAAFLGQNVLRSTDPASLEPCEVGEQLLLLEWVPLLPAGELLPPAPPPALAAALAGGLLPCLERLLRRAGEEPDGPESAMVSPLLREGQAWRLWGPLLEYGEPRQAAALVATLGKLLRRANHAEASFGGGRAVIHMCAAVLDGPVAVPSKLIEAEGRQIGRLLMYAACVWLPALSDRVFQAMAAQPAPDAADSEDVWGLLRPLLTWLPVLVHRCASSSAAGAAAGCGTTAAADPSGCSAAGDAGGWRELLLEGMHVVPLLAAALWFAALQCPRAGCLPLARSCCAVAAAFPDEMLCTASGYPAWPPALLRALLPELRAQGQGAYEGVTEALAIILEGASATGSCSSGGGGGAGFARGGGDAEARARFLAAVATTLGGEVGEMAARLVPPAEARALLRTCSYPGCTSLAGDSEADARMRWCRFCSSCCYCCGECQLSHWRQGGHKEACPGAAKARLG